MFVLDRVSIARGSGAQATVVLDEVTSTLPSDEVFTVLGVAGSGLTTLAHLLSGILRPDSGHIARPPRVSFPLGYASGFSRQLSVRQNIVHASRLYDADPKEILSFVAGICAEREELETDWGSLLAPRRAAIAHAIGYALPFNVYIVDNVIAAGSGSFREACFAMFEQRARQGGIILMAKDIRVARRFAQRGAVLKDGKLHAFNDFEDAEAILQSGAGIAP